MAETVTAVELEELPIDESTKRRMLALLERPETGTEHIPIERSFQSTPLNYSHKPNCHGTTAHVLSVEETIKEQWRTVQRQGKRLWEGTGTQEERYDKFQEEHGEFIFFPHHALPGYVGPVFMQLFLSSGEVSEADREEAVGGIISVCRDLTEKDGFPHYLQRICSNLNPERVPRHTGIYLGDFQGHHIAFQQQNMGCEFELVDIEQSRDFRDGITRYFKLL
jgi:hypothetical protein